LRPRGELTEDKLELYKKKYDKCMACVQLMDKFENFIDEERWNEQFEVKLDMYLTQVASVNMRIFMGMPLPLDL
jgi:hypothetical protein